MKIAMRRVGIIVLGLLLLCQPVLAAELIPVGQVIGLELSDGTVTISAFDENLGSGALAAGLLVGDQILQVDQTPVTCAQDIRYALERSDGTVTVCVLRAGKKTQVTVRPAVTEDGPKLGVYLKQGVTGVGTVTWYDPDNGTFGALGHGVNGADGALLSMEKGTVYRASVVSVKKGMPGDPGQLMGTVTSQIPIGTLEKNTDRGIFGTVQSGWSGKICSTCPAREVRTGEATILSTVAGDTVQEYSVEIVKIYPNAGTAGRNLLLRVTDPALLEATGGIVQGMSGSPILQNGRIVGAVTHVLVNDPTTGYGIFIENMLDAA